MFDHTHKDIITFSSFAYDSDDDLVLSSELKKKSDINDYEDPINIGSENNSIIHDIVRYIENLKSNNYITIIDGENLIGGPPNHRSSKVKRIFNKYNDPKKTIILVVKKSGGVKRFKNYTGVDVPENFKFISLHADNGTCPDDGFILELSHKLKNTIVVTDDEFSNRENFNYGDLYYGTKLTTNFGIEGRYIPDVLTINKSLIKKRNINKKKSPKNEDEFLFKETQRLQI